MMELTNLRNRIRTLVHADEHVCVERLLLTNNLSAATRGRVLENARRLVTQCRKDRHGKGTLDAFLQEFGLSNKEGVALMCLAEALLRIPDDDTADRLIAEKIKAGDWGSHRGRSDSAFVNASTWGLMLTGRIINLDAEITEQTGNWMSRLVGKLGEPVVRTAVLQAMRIMGGQYVLGRSIEEGMKRGARENPPGTRFSFDMLGEAARTMADAERYYRAYADAIETIGKSNQAGDVCGANGISVKLSALHPRYHYSHRETVMAELLPRIRDLCLRARTYNLGLSIDAEESERLDISLDIFEALARDPELANWDGLGFVLQAYLKRAPAVADWLIALARECGRRLMVRLVKGAYWDAEIKRAQELGFADYPVYTRKPNTDLSYQICAEKLLAAQDAVFPQFATHNAYTAALIMELAGDRKFEFQRLHGMGHLLYRQLQNDYPQRDIPLRVYAPIGKHKDLLPYLVRRLLENGANSSFVNRFLDNEMPVDQLVADVVRQVNQAIPHRHRKIPLPVNLYRAAGEPRGNARGIDLDNPIEVQPLLQTMAAAADKPLSAGPIVGGEARGVDFQPVYSPTDDDRVVGQVAEPDENDMEDALQLATVAQPGWNSLGGGTRAGILDNMALALEAHCEELMGIITAEAGRSIPDALSEVREAVDFCRYYALQARRHFEGQHSLEGRGTFLCISPWNFPLAIFTGQLAAALAAGNAAIAKPAEQTPLISARAVQLFHRAGVPGDILHLLPGDGARIGGRLIPDARLSGVAFTGSTETARLINGQLARRDDGPIPLIAETGGQNAMIVDSTALPEQVVDDVIISAFQSAGQRCSALRVLYLQEDIADIVLTMLKGAMEVLEIGDPARLATDVGPVIDREAMQMLENHNAFMRDRANLIAEATINGEQAARGTFVPPRVFEIRSLKELQREVFGPILHVIRYKSSQLNHVLREIDESGYGLTLGVHSRIEAFGEYVFRNTRVGNTYINRNMVGAVVGVNPFGGRGLSGTGPKAGGPHYLFRFAAEPPPVAGRREEALPLQPGVSRTEELDPMPNLCTNAFHSWHRLPPHRRAEIFEQAAAMFRASDEWNSGEKAAAGEMERAALLIREHLLEPLTLPGPTGEQNLLFLQGRGPVLAIPREGAGPANLAAMASLPLAAGCTLAVAAPDSTLPFLRQLQQVLLASGLAENIFTIIPSSALGCCLADSRIAAVTSTGDGQKLRQIQRVLAEREGPIIPLVALPPTENRPAGDSGIFDYRLLVRFMHEKTRTENLVARGGNTQLFNLRE